jgi:hypothetical protein
MATNDVNDDRRWWSVLVATHETDASPEARPITDEAVDAFADALEPHHGGPSVGLIHWEARIAVVADNVVEAIGSAVRIVTEAAREAGMPELPVSEVEAMRWDVFEEWLGPI